MNIEKYLKATPKQANLTGKVLAVLLQTLTAMMGLTATSAKGKEAIASFMTEVKDSGLPESPWLFYRLASGSIRNLLGTSVKVEKGEKQGVLTKVMYLAPSTLSGFNTCPMAGSCSDVCLGHSSGRLAFTNSQASQVMKTLFLKFCKRNQEKGGWDKTSPRIPIPLLPGERRLG